jgi:hypothetical protein
VPSVDDKENELAKVRRQLAIAKLAAAQMKSSHEFMTKHMKLENGIFSSPNTYNDQIRFATNQTMIIDTM